MNIKMNLKYPCCFNSGPISDLIRHKSDTLGMRYSVLTLTDARVTDVFAWVLEVVRLAVLAVDAHGVVFAVVTHAS